MGIGIGLEVLTVCMLNPLEYAIFNESLECVNFLINTFGLRTFMQAQLETTILTI